MAYDKSDPRSSLGGAAVKKPDPTEYAKADYVRFYYLNPDETSSGVKTWYGRGQAMIVSYSEVEKDAAIELKGQPDEYMLFLNDRNISVEITAGKEVKKVDGFTITIIPPGDSTVRVLAKGCMYRIFSSQSEALAKKCSNAASYIKPSPNVAPYKAWPEPPAGYKIRSYSLAVPDEPGRFGRLWRCTSLMVNVCAHEPHVRDIKKFSPHVHDDFEQCSLSAEGVFVHHVRWPWITDSTKWLPDDHEVCGTPSIAILPPPAIHTTGAVAPSNQLVDIFSPPRMDFSEKKGWVLNADEYPMP
jgi:hypothetical protein